jgi:tRNA A37 methylthiotransferase MiaB
MPGPVPERIAGERAEALLELGRTTKASYLNRWVGKELRAILEVGLGATSENYLKLRIRGLPETARAGQEVSCRIETRSRTEHSSEVDAFALYTDLPPPFEP